MLRMFANNYSSKGTNSYQKYKNKHRKTKTVPRVVKKKKAQ